MLGTYTIQNGYGEKGGLVKLAGTTCTDYFLSIKNNEKEFIDRFKDEKNTSMLEFAWIVMRVRVKPMGTERDKIINDVYNYYKGHKYLNVSITDIGIIVSGNARAWMECLDRVNYTYADGMIINNLKQTHKQFFGEWEQATNHNFIYVENLNEKTVLGLAEEEREKHHWMMVKFNNISRLMADELRAHRIMSHAMESTIQVVKDNFRVVMGADDSLYLDNVVAEGNDVHDDSLIDSWESLTSSLYKRYREKYGNTVARRFLPLSVYTNMCVAGTLEDWQKVFKVRCIPGVDWEIKTMCTQLRGQLRKQKLIKFEGN
jgi:hypothetical protein